MNRLMGLAAGLMALTTAIHVFMGGPEVSLPVQQSDLPEVVRAVSIVVWHAITWILAVLALAIAYMAVRPNAGLFWMTVAIQAGFATLFVWYGLVQLGNLTEMPQWIIFSGVPALMLWAERRQPVPN